MYSTELILAGCVGVLLLAGCATRQVGHEAVIPDRGDAVRTNIAIQSGDRSVLQSLSQDFRQSVPDMVNFAFDSAVLDPAEQRILDQQAAWILRHPSIRLRIYGHTDLVGGAAYNFGLGKRRADAVATYLIARGVNPAQLEAVVSFGKTRPLVDTTAPERANRRTVTEVDGFVSPTAQWNFDGKRAHETYLDYVAGEVSLPGGDGGGYLDMSLSD